ncbi:hypothetical protein YC2023_018870 [Brassica napus]
MAQKSNLPLPKATLTQLGKQLVFLKLIQHNPQILSMLFFTPRINQNVVDENDHTLIQVLPKHIIHKLHERCRCVRQSKWHHHKLIMPIACTEGRLPHISISYRNLVVSRCQVNFIEPRSSLQLVQQLVNTRKRILILDGHFVQTSIVDTKSETPIFLFHEQHWCSPR